MFKKTERFIRQLEFKLKNSDDPLAEIRGLKTNLRQFDKLAQEDVKRHLAEMEREVKERFTKEYYRFKKTGYKRYFPNLKAYRLDDLTPKFRAELRRQTEISLSYITTTTEDEMRQLRNRFLNWMANPTPETRQKGVDLDFSDKHTRFIIRDQSRKLEGNLSEITARESGAFAFIWRTRRDNRVVGNPSGLYPKGTPQHEDHFERNGKLFLMEDSYFYQKGLVKKSKSVILDTEIDDGMPSKPIGCRCWATYIYRLEDIPDEYKFILTEKGKRQIENK